jgi:DNA methylase
MTDQSLLPFNQVRKPKLTIAGVPPYYGTALGDAYLADALEVLKTIPDTSVNAVVTSPPYALHFKKEYGNAPKHDYVEWFLPFAAEILRILAADGSFVLNIGGSYNKGVPIFFLPLGCLLRSSPGLLRGPCGAVGRPATRTQKGKRRP